MINDELIENSRSRLLEEKKRLENLLGRIAKKDNKGGDFHAAYQDFGTSTDENASEVADYEEKVAEEFDLEQKLHRVESALLRIEQGKYGICLKGGEEMPPQRLEAAPEAENCIEHEPS